MNKRIIFACMLLIALLSSSPVLAQISAQEPDPTATPAAAPADQEDVYTFPILGFTETRLIGPFDSTGIQVSFPEEWTYPNPSRMHLEYSLSFFGQDYVPGQTLIGGVLDVEVNGNIVASFSLSQDGDFASDITLPASALLSDRTDGRMQITFNLVSEESCVRDFDVNLVVKESSYIYLPHGVSTPETDLTLLPRPFYQPNALFDRTAILVLPQDPSTAELQAVMDVSAGFGSLTGGGLLLTTLTADQLTTAQRNAENLILVGKAASLDLVDSLDLPVAAGTAGFTLNDENDGILQLVASPWNNERVVLLVSGNSDEGVIKAGQAIKYGTILTTTANDVAMVESYRTEASAPLAATDRTFLELGYEDRNMRSSGTNYANYQFYIPPGQSVSTDAYLDLFFSHSALLNFETSGMTIILNGRVISSVPFSQDTTQLSEVQVSLPPSAFIQGTNELQIQVQLIPYDSCTDLTNFISTWGAIFSDSSLHLPLVTGAVNTTGTLNLNGFPENMAVGDVQGNVTFVLPAGAPQVWQTAAAVAYEMGNQLDEALSQVSVQFVDDLDQTELAANNVVLFGQPSQLPLVYDWSDALPAPFSAGSEVPYDPASRIVYRVVEGSTVGYLELFASPWAADKAVLLVSGNSPAGVTLAGSALGGNDLRGSLAGNFAIISSGQIVSLDSRYPVDSQLLAAETGTQPPAAAPSTQPSEIQRANRAWMLPAILVITLLTVAVILIKLLPVLKKKDDNGNNKEDEETK
ncbi:MAG: cellulose synthase operon protein [Chloroflexota bacterium]|nr:cellulose synthase operon protein [Chloroflexota bacterium]